jgi:flagellar hook-length control protein FliK
VAVQPHLQANTDGSFQQGSQGSDSGDAHARHGSTAAGLTTDAASATTQTAAPDQTFAATAAAAWTATTAPAVPANVHPGEVVSQIAHQADLYRLPGNKGVRIQLHPDDLGGVQVTVRYAAGGGLELHINVEHASTGALVQAGWTELRDALATQGISPDRLVMSVTGPSSAPGSSGQMDFSSNNNSNSYRSSDSSLSGSGGEPGQQRHDGAPAEDARATRRWGAVADSNSSADETPRASASRIDYRV